MTIQPKEAWFVPFGPVREANHVKVAALNKFRETTGLVISHGKLLTRVEDMLRDATPVVSTQEGPRFGVDFFLYGTSPSDQPGVLFIVRDEAVISIKHANRSYWAAKLQ